jgi:hypothetical protein
LVCEVGTEDNSRARIKLEHNSPAPTLTAPCPDLVDETISQQTTDDLRQRRLANPGVSSELGPRGLAAHAETLVYDVATGPLAHRWSPNRANFHLVPNPY